MGVRDDVQAAIVRFVRFGGFCMELAGAMKEFMADLAQAFDMLLRPQWRGCACCTGANESPLFDGCQAFSCISSGDPTTFPQCAVI